MIAVVQFVFTLGMALAVSAVNVFFRDLGNVLRHGLRLWFYLSPALYACPGSRTCNSSRTTRSCSFARANPFAILFESYRAVIYGTPERPGAPTGSPSRSLLVASLVLVGLDESSSSGSSPVREGPLMSDRAQARTGTHHAIDAPTSASATTSGSPGSRRSARRSRSCLAPEARAVLGAAPRVVHVIRGESLAVIGPNGAGKSTLLQVLAGIILPSEGAVDVRGHVSSLLTLGAGFDPDLSGRENILLAGAFLGLDDMVVRELLPAIVDFADLGQFIDAPIKTYSSGMRARLGSRSRRPSTPTSSCSTRCSRRAMRLPGEVEAARHRARAGRQGIVLVTHDMDWVTEYCNRALLLEKGNVVIEGEPAEVVRVHEEHSARRKAEKQAQLGSVAAAAGPLAR